VVKLTELHKFKLLATLVPKYFVFTDQVPGSFKERLLLPSGVRSSSSLVSFDTPFRILKFV